MKPIMDLVINHTAIDSPLVEAYPSWYVRDEKGEVVHPSAIDPEDARKVTVWGDLAEIDNQKSEDLDRLWDYWRDLVRFYTMLGFEGQLFGDQHINTYQESTRSHDALTYDGTPATGRWQPSQLAPGHKLGDPAPLFKKLDDDVAEQEKTRLGT